MKFISIIIFIFTLNIHAESSEAYIGLCASKEELVNYYKSQGDNLDESDIKGVNKDRLGILAILKGGEKVMTEKLNTKGMGGAAGVLSACHFLVQIESEVKEKGCFDLSTNEKISDNGALDFCHQIHK